MFVQSFLFSDWLDDPFPPNQPSEALPGTPAKLKVLIERRRRNEALWHPCDSKDPLRRAKLVRRLANGAIATLSTVEG